MASFYKTKTFQTARVTVQPKNGRWYCYQSIAKKALSRRFYGNLRINQVAGGYDRRGETLMTSGHKGR
jgi:hypothetical protein